MAEVQHADATATEREAGSRRSRRLWTVAILSFVALSGLGMQMRGPLLPVLGEQWGLSDGQLGLVGPAGTVGYVVTVLVTGAVAGRIDSRRFFLGGLAVATASVFAMALSPSVFAAGLAPFFLTFLGFLVLRGMGTGVVRALDRPMLSHFYPDARGRVFNLYDLAWAVGAAAGPAIMGLAVSRGDWRTAYYGLGVAFAVLLAFVWSLDAPDDSAESPLDVAGAVALLKKPAIAATALGLTFHTGLEGAMFLWLPTFGGRVAGLDQSAASLLLSVFLVAYIPGRLVYTVISERVSYGTLVIALEALIVPTFYVTFFVLDGRAIFVGVAVLGALVSGVFPTVVAFATEAAPEYSAPVNAIAMATGSLAIAIVPLTVGIVAEDVGIRAAMWVPLVMTLAVGPVVFGARLLDPNI
jgi:fucose permease